MIEALLNYPKTQTLIFVFLAFFTVFSMFFISITLIIRVYHIIIKRRRQRLYDHFSNMLFAYLDQPQDEIILQNFRKLTRRDLFFDFILNYLQILRGRDYQLILNLLHLIKIPQIMKNNLRHSNKWKRAYAAYFLGFLKYEEAISSLAGSLNDSFYLVRFHAARSIIQIRNFDYIKLALQELLKIPGLSQYQIMEALVELNEDGLAICLELFREEKHFQENQKNLFVELFSYKRFTGASEDIMMTMLGAKRRELKISCIRALGLLHYTPAIPVLHQYFDTGDWVIKSQLLRTLGRIGDISSLSEIKACLKSENFWVRYNAALALYDLGEVGIDHLNKIRSDKNHPGFEISNQVWLERNPKEVTKRSKIVNN